MIYDGQPTDFLNGSFEFDTQIDKDGDIYVASAMGVSARHRSMEQAINDLNSKIDIAITRGELVPNQG